MGELLDPLARGDALRAYYYRFEPTGCKPVDDLLAAVAHAGKLYHHTAEWNESPIGYDDSPIASIQRMADKAAKEWAAEAGEEEQRLRICVDALAKAGLSGFNVTYTDTGMCVTGPTGSEERVASIIYNLHKACEAVAEDLIRRNALRELVTLRNLYGVRGMVRGARGNLHEAIRLLGGDTIADMDFKDAYDLLHPEDDEDDPKVVVEVPNG